MPRFIMTKTARQLLASCIEIGFEGAEENDEETGGENSAEDLEQVAAILDELRESEADETVVHIAPKPTYEREIVAGGVTGRSSTEPAGGAHPVGD